MLTETEVLLYTGIGLIPSMVCLFGYIIRMERSLAKIKTNICWIKKELEKRE
jgi:hypothetical protein